MLNLYNLIIPYLIYLIIGVILAIVLFLIYRPSIPKPSTKKSIIFSIAIAIVMVITLYFDPWLYFPASAFPGYYLFIYLLLFPFIIGLALSLVVYIIYDYKIAFKIGGLTIMILVFTMIILAAPAY